MDFGGVLLTAILSTVLLPHMTSAEVRINDLAAPPEKIDVLAYLDCSEWDGSGRTGRPSCPVGIHVERGSKRAKSTFPEGLNHAFELLLLNFQEKPERNMCC